MRLNAQALRNGISWSGPIDYLAANGNCLAPSGYPKG